MGNIEKAVQFMIDVANDDTHGYDQTNRNSPDYDCSSLVGTALNVAGFSVSPYSWTGNLKSQLLSCGFELIPVNDKRKRGDIFLTENHHVVMCVDSENIVHASINEKGTVTGGKTGDQTGKEICVRNFYTPSYGWDYHFRIKEQNDDESPTIKIIKSTKYADEFDRTLAGIYYVTASELYVRNGAGKTNSILTSIPEGTRVRNYGYYTEVNGVKWLYVQFVYKNVQYTAFCSSKHLSR